MSKKKNKTILILGDWYIDENWLLSPQQLYHSSATGDIHYLALHKTTSERVTNLCAAAALLESLKAHVAPRGQPHFVAFGAWNPDDNDTLRRLLCPHNLEERHLSPHTLANFSPAGVCSKCNGDSASCPYSRTLFNIATPEDRKVVSTNRIIRCFEGHGGTMPHQLYRMDWMLPLALHRSRYDHIPDTLRDDEVLAVIVVDHGAGVVNPDAVAAVLRAAPRAQWYVRTKLDNPAWHMALRGRGIEPTMVIIDHRLGRYKKGARRCWHGRHLGRAALELLDELTGGAEGGLRAENAVVLWEDNTVFAMSRAARQVFAIGQPPGPPQIMNLGRTTIFCAGLFAQCLTALLKPGSQVTLGEQCEAALQCSYRWTVGVSKKWSQEDLSLYEEYATALDSLKSYQPKHAEGVAADSYDTLRDTWKHSAEGLGVVKMSGRAALQLWRGEAALPGYICIGEAKRAAVDGLVSSVARYLDQKRPTQSYGCLVQSAPGWGKTYLAKRLAAYFEMDCLEYSLAQMCDARDLLNCFISIASAQSQSARRTLVFMDELNAGIAGASVMALLLSPLWGGTFSKDGHVFRLRPSVWVFASTSPAGELVGDSKGSDFLSRLSGPIIELDSDDHYRKALASLRPILTARANMTWDEYRTSVFAVADYHTFASITEDPRKTEQVYLMATLLRKELGPISGVEQSVLRLFHDLLPTNGSRSLELLAGRFRAVQRGVIREENVPRFDLEAALRRHVVPPEWWVGRESKRQEVVAIETRIP